MFSMNDFYSSTSLFIIMNHKFQKEWADTLHDTCLHLAQEHATHEVTSHSVPQSTGSVQEVDGPCHKHAGGQQVAEEARTPEPDMDSNMQIDNGEGNQSNTSSGPLGAACASTSLRMEVDFEQLAKEERIGKLRAKLRQEEANNDDIEMPELDWTTWWNFGSLKTNLTTPP